MNHRSGEAVWSSVRSNMSIVGILQGTSQLKERYGEETAETIFNSCHDTIAGAFGPLSQDAEFLSKQLGSRTARTGSVTTDGKTGEQSSNVITTDSIILDHCLSWFNLMKLCAGKNGAKTLRVWE